MASLRQIRRRMRSIENIHEITKAMEMIAAFRFKRSENRYARSRAYFLEIERLFSNLVLAAAEIADPRHPILSGQALFEKRQIRKKALVVITTDKGLCGAHNSNLLKAAGAWAQENRESETYFIPVGKVGADILNKRRAQVLSSYPEKSRADLALARQITADLKSFFLGRKVDSVEILYMTFHAGRAGRIRVAPSLGLAYLLEGARPDRALTDYLYEPGFGDVFTQLLTRFLEGQMYGILLESMASEYLARMIAMKQATENGEEVLDQLKLLRNKTRQATITREISEIVGGASVLV